MPWGFIGYDMVAMTEWLTPNEAAAYLKVNRRTLYGLMASGRLPYHQMRGSGRRRIRREDLDALLVPGEPRKEEAGGDECEESGAQGER
jgi:excisionase family DNA binding protein